MLIEITRKQALAYGLLTCKHCLFPPNNHFGNGERGGKNAHVDCPGYEEESTIGKIKRRR